MLLNSQNLCYPKNSPYITLKWPKQQTIWGKFLKKSHNLFLKGYLNSWNPGLDYQSPVFEYESPWIENQLERGGDYQEERSTPNVEQWSAWTKCSFGAETKQRFKKVIQTSSCNSPRPESMIVVLPFWNSLKIFSFFYRYSRLSMPWPFAKEK